MEFWEEARQGKGGKGDSTVMALGRKRGFGFMGSSMGGPDLK